MKEYDRRSNAPLHTIILVETVALLVLVSTSGCDQFLEDKKVKTEVQADRTAFLQENLPEFELVCDELASEIESQQARLKERNATLGAVGRKPEEDPVCRRWEKLLANMQKDFEELQDAGTDLYLGDRQRRSAGSVGESEIRAQAKSLDKARKLAASMQRNLENYKKELEGKTRKPKDIPDPSRITGEISWPSVLTRSEYTAYRTEIEKAFAEQAEAGRLSEERLAEAKVAASRMTEELKSHVTEIRPQEYIEAKAFISTLHRQLIRSSP